jgi:hypothetical protein
MSDTAATDIQKIEDILAKPTTDAGTKTALTEQVDKAKAALASGDEKQAVAITKWVGGYCILA